MPGSVITHKVQRFRRNPVSVRNAMALISSFAMVPTRGVTGTDNASVSEALVAPVKVRGPGRLAERKPPT
jgi:hypothetical protein